jgi:hypothetical protein
MLLFSDAPLATTPVHATYELVRGILPPAWVHPAVIGLFLGISSLAFWGLWRWWRQGKLETFSFIPQQLVLMGSAAGAILSTVQGHYADGTPAPPMHIFSDQLIHILIAIAHTWAFWEVLLEGPVAAWRTRRAER